MTQVAFERPQRIEEGDRLATESVARRLVDTTRRTTLQAPDVPMDGPPGAPYRLGTADARLTRLVEGTIRDVERLQERATNRRVRDASHRRVDKRAQRAAHCRQRR